MDGVPFLFNFFLIIPKHTKTPTARAVGVLCVSGAKSTSYTGSCPGGAVHSTA